MSEPTPMPLADESLACPGCGYDLRALSSGRCPECGLAIDPADLRESAIPWVHRRKLGRTRAYLKTVWWMVVGSRRLAMESARPHDWADARSFRRVTTTLMATLLLAIFAAVAWGDGYVVFAVQKSGSFMSDDWWQTGMGLDLSMPWSAGATITWVLPLCLIGFAFALTGVPQCLFDFKSITDAQRQRGVPLVTYASSPIILLWPATIGVAVLAWLNNSDSIWAKHVFNGDWIAIAIGLVAGVFGVLAMGLSSLRPLQWLRRITHCGVIAMFLGWLRWQVLFAINAVFWLWLIPWCAGFVWIVIDSFRG